MSSRTSGGLVRQHIEGISSQAFDSYHNEITKLVGKNHGVYALYKKDKLYYVGLATDLRRRVNHHLRDRHKGKWDSFSLYLIHDVNYIRELEALIVHIASPRGNLQLGRFARSENLLKSFQRMMEERDRLKRERILGGKKQGKTKVRRPRSTRHKSGSQGRPPGLRGLLKDGTVLKGTYKKQEYTATVVNDGQIQLIEECFNSPSMASIKIKKRHDDGWLFWKFQNADGDWVLIDKLRK